MKYILFPVILFQISCTSHPGTQPAMEISEEAEFVIDTLLTDLQNPGGISWVNDTTMIFSERGDATQPLNLWYTDSEYQVQICNVPSVHRAGDGGMLDVLVDPQYETRPFLYFAYSHLFADSTSTLRVERARLVDACLVDRSLLFEAQPAFKSNAHYGSRLQIKSDYLFITMGERYTERDSAQSLSNHFGKVMRIHVDGRIPSDNPWVDQLGVLPEIWSYGHRNPQGLAFRNNGSLWLHEHGPQGGDEVNLVQPGSNYGWPVITYGEEYGGGPIGAGITEKAGMQQPVYQYTPSIAPSGMFFYYGEAFPQWKGNLFLGAMAKKHLNRLILEADKVVHEERLLLNKDSRIRAVQQGPKGYIYLGSDDGVLCRLRPTHKSSKPPIL